MERRSSGQGVLSVEEALQELGLSPEGSIFIARVEDVHGVSVNHGSLDYPQESREFPAPKNTVKSSTSYV